MVSADRTLACDSITQPEEVPIAPLHLREHDPPRLGVASVVFEQRGRPHSRVGHRRDDQTHLVDEASAQSRLTGAKRTL
jgi:hypothetical protein